MQAAAIKRVARLQNSDLRMSANNARDVLWYLLAKGIVRRIIIKRRSHPRYELTELGKAFQELLLGVRTRRVEPPSSKKKAVKVRIPMKSATHSD